MRKTTDGRTESPKNKSRVLARILAEDLRRTQACDGLGGSVVNTITDLGDQYDVTFKGGDASSY